LQEEVCNRIGCQEAKEMTEMIPPDCDNYNNGKCKIISPQMSVCPKNCSDYKSRHEELCPICSRIRIDEEKDNYYGGDRKYGARKKKGDDAE
jgi:hypothetical protein